MSTTAVVFNGSEALLNDGAQELLGIFVQRHQLLDVVGSFATFQSDPDGILDDFLELVACVLPSPQPADTKEEARNAFFEAFTVVGFVLLARLRLKIEVAEIFGFSAGSTQRVQD